jgi:Trm5-related predicted tRNA methylase
MKKIIVVCLVMGLMGMLPFTVYAGACGDFEYAELMDMDRAMLLKEYCKESAYVKKNLEVFILGGMVKDVESCLNIVGKMQRVYMKRFNIETPAAMNLECK